MPAFRPLAACIALIATPLAAQTVPAPQPVYVAPDGRPKAVEAFNRIGKDGGIIGPSTMIATTQAAVGTSATLVCPARIGRQRVILTELAAVDFYYGPAGVTSLSGAFVKGAAGASVAMDASGPIYAVGASAVTISCAELY